MKSLIYFSRHSVSDYLPLLKIRLGVFLSIATFSTCFSQSFLSASGSKIVDQNNNEVLLQGMGLGGWLLMEGYMLQVDGGYGQWQIKKEMHANGATEAEIETFFANWRNSHTTASDIAYLKSLGLNCMRLPMHYELFLTSSQRAVRNNVIYGNITADSYVQSLTNWYDQNALFTDVTADGFTIIDKVLQWAGTNGMWVILDLHAAPGGQGSQTNINDALVGLDLWNRTDSQGRKIYQLITERLWKAISNRYKTDSRIAMYDLLNEPHGGVQNTTIKSLYDQLISAIRNNGDNHLLLLEGNGYGNEYTNITPDLFPGQTNLVWNGHRYWVTNDPTTKDRNANQLNLIANLVNFRAKWNVPVWVGETGENSNHWIANACKNLNDKKIGWCLWTEKRLHGSNSSLAQTASPLKVSYANIYTAAGRTQLLNNIQFANCIEQKDYKDAMTRMINDDTTLPYNDTRAVIPGKIFASDYDIGKNGSAYNDDLYEKIPYDGSDWNFGYTYRNDGVDIEASQDLTGNGVNVGWLEYNDWMNYSINVLQSGNYQVEFRTANGARRSGALTLKVDGATVGTINSTPTGGYQNWTTITMGNAINLTAGNHVVQVLVNSRNGGGNLSWINFSFTSSARNTVFSETLINTGQQVTFGPNPVKDRLQILNLSEKAILEIYDVSGRKINLRGKQISNGYFDLSTLQPGAYILQIIDGTKIKTGKIIKD